MFTSTEETEKFVKRLASYSKSMKDYENPDWQASAKAIIPLDTLTDRALEKMDGQENPSFEDELFKQLLAWFKHEFFQWVNQPACGACTSPTKFVQYMPPDPVDAYFGASRVELYSCEVCGSFTKFPRYNHAQKLLETRRGRCGEWAQCFTLCARSLGYEVRMVHDWTDHVWNEVYSEDQKKWLHCDSCENSIDSPNLYETGWGKKLTYLVAVSTEEIVDVTPKYTKKYDEVLSRRTLVPEDWLADHIEKSQFILENNIHYDRKKILKERRQNEAGDLKKKFENEKVSEDEKHGRISGSEEWRAERGELGDVEKTRLAEEKEEQIKKELAKEK